MIIKVQKLCVPKVKKLTRLPELRLGLYASLIYFNYGIGAKFILQANVSLQKIRNLFLSHKCL